LAGVASGLGGKALVPARLAGRYRISCSIGIYPQKKYAGRRYKRIPGYYSGYYIQTA
jgi:hypothetical protein